MAYEYRTIDVVLPVRGETVKIQETNAFSEQGMFKEGLTGIEGIVDYWVSSIKAIGENNSPTRKDFYDLTEPDRVFISIENFKVSISDTILLTGPCAGCGEPANFEVPLNSLDLIPIPDGATPPDPLFTVTLPRTKHVVIFGYRTGHQELEEMSNSEFNPSKTVWRAIRSVDGKTNVKLQEIMAWPMADHIALRREVLSKQCGYDTRVKFVHSCGRRLTMNLISDPSFLTPGLAW